MPLEDVVGDTEPHGAAEHDTVHVTPRFAVSFATAAVRLVVWPVWSETEFGDTETLMGGADVLPPPQPGKVKLTHMASASIP